MIRPRDATDVYSNPAIEFRRLAGAGLLLSLVHGYYAIPSSEWMGNPSWRPPVEAVALGIGQADYGLDAAALSGISAARVLGGVPRALSVGLVSIPARRRPLTTVAGTVIFWQRPTGALDLQRHRTELAQGWVTTPEQTILDVADRPTPGGVSARTTSEAIWALAGRCDWELVAAIGRDQHRRAAYARVRWVADAIVPDAPMPTTGGRRVSARGLSPVEPTPRSRFGIAGD